MNSKMNVFVFEARELASQLMGSEEDFHTMKLIPQPQLPFTFGFLNTKPADNLSVT